MAVSLESGFVVSLDGWSGSNVCCGCDAGYSSSAGVGLFNFLSAPMAYIQFVRPQAFHSIMLRAASRA